MTTWAYDMKYCPKCGNKLHREFIDERDRLVCKNCGFVFWNNPIPVVAAIVPYKGGIVLVKSSIRKTWGLPAGHVEYGDTAEERVLLEVKEETNLDAEIDEYIGTWNKSDHANLLIIVFSVKVNGGVLKPGGDVEAVKVFSIDEAKIILKGKAAEKALNKWLKIKNEK